MKKAKKVIIRGREDVLGRAFETFLENREEWNVIRIADDEPEEALVKFVEKENPDVVILYGGNYKCITSLPFQLMQNRPHLRVITASLQDNNLEVYDKRKICITNVADLFSAMDK